MKENKTVNFTIDSIDPLGQGVSKIEDRIVFIQKSLPGESGKADIFKASKHVNFATLKEINTPSSKRIQPDCDHFAECGGCHFLHCSYEDELAFKLESLQNIFERQFRINLNSPIQLIKGLSRFEYRNRVQLQYNKKFKSLGFYNVDNSKIVHTENCRMPKESLGKYLNTLYKNDEWLKTLKKQPAKGHIEIYERDGKVTTAINERYAHVGFTQVFKEMNDLLLTYVESVSKKYTTDNSHTFDLFGGNGNLSRFCSGKISVVDSTPEKFISLPMANQSYKKLSLFDDNFLSELGELTQNEIQHTDFTIIDPPRSGFKTIDQFTQSFNPKTILYVSCNPQTLARDISKISDNYSIEKILLFDFFPGTRHYESVALLQRKNG